MQISKLKHLDHLEDFPVRYGQEGFDQAFSVLMNTHEFLKGKTPSEYQITTKWDGVFSCVFGYLNNKFFVGTKSVFSKKPKINYTIDDIQRNYKDAPRLIKKLSLALELLKTASPDNGIYQGDFLYTDSDIEKVGQYVSFTPNTITYKVKKDSKEGQRILNSKLGMVVHTKYRANYGESDLGNMTVRYDVDQKKFNSTDVNFIDPNLETKYDYTIKNENDFYKSAFDAKKLNLELQKTDVYNLLKTQNNLVLGYINSAVKAKKELSPINYIMFIKKQEKKNIESVKLDKTKQKLSQSTNDLIKIITENKNSFEKLFDMHKKLAEAKDILINALSKHSLYSTSILDNPSKPEGFVVIYKNVPMKLVDRKEFSFSNFEWNEKVNPKDNPMVIAFGKMDVVHKGHEKVKNKVLDVARRINAKHQIIVAADKNGKGLKEKIENAKAAFPDANVVSSTDDKGLFSQLKNLYRSGVKNLTIVTGADRIKKYNSLIMKYNNKDGYFSFKKFRVISAGERDETNDNGVEGLSSSKLRSHAKNGNYEEFKKGMPSTYDEIKTKKLYDKIRQNKEEDKNK